MPALAVALLFADAPTLSTRFAPLRLTEALARLSTPETHLEPAPALRSELLFVRLEKAPVSTVMTKVAALFDAKWEKRADGVFVLKPDMAARDRRRKAFREAEHRDWAGSVAYVRRRLGEQPAELDAAFVAASKAKQEAEEARAKRAMESNNYDLALIAPSGPEERPGWRALARIVPLLDEAQLLAMPYTSRIVFAERPTAMQQPVPFGWAPALSQYRRELALVKKGNVDRVRISVERWEFGGRFSATLTALDASGANLDQASIRLANDSDILKKPGGHKQPPIPAKPDEKPLEISDASLEHQKVFSTEAQMGPAERRQLLTKWKPILLNPVKNEPMSWMPGEGYVAAANAMGKNLIGTVGELSGERYAKPRLGERPSQFLGRMGNTDLDSDGWMVVRPSEPYERLDRGEAGMLLRSASDNGGMPLDLAAAWAATHGDRYPFTNWLGDTLMTLLPSRGPNSALATILDEDGLRLWAALGAGARDALRQGQTLDLSRLPAAAIQQISRDVYWFRSLGEDVEPTEAMPNGIGGGTVRMDVAEAPIISSWVASEGEPVTDMPLTAEQFGSSLVKGSRYWELSAEQFRVRDRFRVGVRRTYTLHFLLQPGAKAMDVELTEIQFDPNVGPLKALPAEIQKQVDAARAKTKPDAPSTNGAPPPVR